jgi:AcrR family transcriptional regulator
VSWPTELATYVTMAETARRRDANDDELSAPEGGTMAAGLTERNKIRTRRELAEAAGRLFLERGYDATTVQDIADAAAVSPRTFFRYFPCKEDIVTALASASMDEVIDHLGGRAANESLRSALTSMLRAVLAPVGDDPEGSRAFQLMLRDTPALRGRWLEERRKSRDRLAEALAPWFPADADPLPARLLAGTVLLVFEEIMTRWADDPTLPNPLGLLDEALRVLSEPLIPTETP